MREYKVERLDASALEERANDLAEEGWQLHNAGLLHINNKVVAVFERDLQYHAVPPPPELEKTPVDGKRRGRPPKARQLELPNT